MQKILYLLVGDSFLAEEKFLAIAAGLEKTYPSAVSRQAFYLKETPLAEVLTQARTLPFLASVQLFRIQEAERVKAEDLDVLMHYLENPSEHTVLVFEALSLDRRTAFAGAMEKKAEVTIFEEAARQRASSRFIREKLKQFEKQMAPGVQRRLEEAAGDMPAFLDSILNQLIIYSEDAAEITEEMLDKFEEKLAPVDAFQLIDAISSRDTSKALQLFYDFAEENIKDLLAFMGLLHWQLRRLWCAKVLMEEGTAEALILKKCKVQPRQSRGFMNQVKSLDRARIEKAVEQLFRLDWDIKTGRAEDRRGLESWIVSLTA